MPDYGHGGVGNQLKRNSLAVRLFHCREPNAFFVTAPIRAAANVKEIMVLDCADEYGEMQSSYL